MLFCTAAVVLGMSSKAHSCGREHEPVVALLAMSAEVARGASWMYLKMAVDPHLPSSAMR